MRYVTINGTIPKYSLCHTNVARLCFDLNAATAPVVPRTAREHARMDRLARALRARLRYIGAVEGLHYIETDSGRLQPLPNFPVAGRVS